MLRTVPFPEKEKWREQKMAVFYHVSTNIFHPGVFEPRVPKYRSPDEDERTPRICVAPSIANCLTSIPNGSDYLGTFNFHRRGYYLVFRIDTEKLGIPEKHIISSEFLYQNDLVFDADITNEHWITTPFIVPEEDRFIIRLVNWEEKVHDIVPYKIRQIAKEKYNSDYKKAYRDVYDGYVPTCVEIYNLQYIHQEVKKDQEIWLYFGNEIEKDLVKSFLRENFWIKIIEELSNEMTFVMCEDANVRELFQYHFQIAQNS